MLANHRKPTFWLVCTAVFAVIVGAIGILSGSAELVDIPDMASVLSIEMEQYSGGESISRVAIGDIERIEAILRALSGASKTFKRSVNDYPTQDSYLVVRLILEDEMRTLCWYSEGGRDYIEQPYVGIYRSSKNSGVTLLRIYAEVMQSTGSNDNLSNDIIEALHPEDVRMYTAVDRHGCIVAAKSSYR